MASGIKYVITTTERVPFPVGKSVKWGDFSPDNEKFSLSVADGKIYFPMTYSSGNFALLLIWAVFLFLNAVVCFFISRKVWRYVRDSKSQAD